MSDTRWIARKHRSTCNEWQWRHCSLIKKKSPELTSIFVPSFDTVGVINSVFCQCGLNFKRILEVNWWWDFEFTVQRSGYFYTALVTRVPNERFISATYWPNVNYCLAYTKARSLKIQIWLIVKYSENIILKYILPINYVWNLFSDWIFTWMIMITISSERVDLQ